MEISESVSDGIVVVTLVGEIDLHASPKLRERLHSLSAKKTEFLAMDFSEVSYIDSSGLATLVEYVRDCKACGGKLAIFGLQPKVLMVFELVRLNELFIISPDRESALSSLIGS